MLLLLLLATGCQRDEPAEQSSAAGGPIAIEDEPAAANATAAGEATTVAGAGDPAPVPTAAALSDQYADALSIPGQLALGTIQLEGSELAVGVAQAEALLPLWQAFATLSGSDTTAAAELDAVVRQIERAMTPEQIAAIAAMALTEGSVQALQESGELVLGGFGARAGGGMGEAGETPAGGVPGMGGGPGGGRGGGMGGGIPGGGPGALPGGEIDEDVMATRQAQFAGGDISFEDTMLVAAVTRLLRTTTGEIVAPGGTINLIWTTIADGVGVDVETLQGEFAAGAAPAEIITGHGGDLDTIRAAILEALAGSNLAAEADLEQFVDDFLNGR
jgi:hypothetical protein